MLYTSVYLSATPIAREKEREREREREREKQREIYK
jgi:hypothetical protein